MLKVSAMAKADAHTDRSYGCGRVGRRRPVVFSTCPTGSLRRRRAHCTHRVSRHSETTQLLHKAVCETWAALAVAVCGGLLVAAGFVNNPTFTELTTGPTIALYCVWVLLVAYTLPPAGGAA